MIDYKALKLDLKKKADKDPFKFYPVSVLEREGFKRKHCIKCKKYFWSTTDIDVCGDSNCLGGYSFLGNSPTKEKLDYLSVWDKFKTLMKKKGYTPIDRYPVTARWRTDVNWVNASIYNFQPYVVSGEVEPPANPLVVPQLCMRFNDVDSVGISGRHNTSFVMIGQHAFYPPEQFNQQQYFEDIYDWLTKGVKIPKPDLVFHEDQWGGGGNLGVSMEFFSRGLELGNQVYMSYSVDEQGYHPLKTKVLDMGMSQSRYAWLSQGKGTSYDVEFPTVCKMLYKTFGLKQDELFLRFMPYAGILNVDETDVEKAWKMIALKLGEDVTSLKEHILSLAAMYSIADHSRTFLIGVNDGALPSNVGSGYDLRLVLRRSLDFIHKYGWNIDLMKIIETHAKYLKPQFKELSLHLLDVQKVLHVEMERYTTNRIVTRKLVENLKGKPLSTEKLIELYDSKGVSPELVVEVMPHIEIPDDFYTQVQARHEQQPTLEIKKTILLSLDDLPETQGLYYDDWKLVDFKAKVQFTDGQYVVLDKTLFYPTSGGQMHDQGSLNGEEVVEIFKQGKYLIHKLKQKPSFKVGELVEGHIDFNYRKQLTQHHSSTHLINAAAKKVLGNHINQAGAKKTLEKAHIDITHYQSLTREELDHIEQEANTLIKSCIPIHKSFIERTQAEKEYGVGIYQGGVVPGKKLRIVNIVGVDVEACGGTHLNNTSEAELIKIIKASKIADGIVRLEFVAGAKAKEYQKQEGTLLDEVTALLGVKPAEITLASERLFNLWKIAGKQLKKLQDPPYLEQVKKGNQVLEPLMYVPLKSTSKSSLDVEELLRETAVLLKTQPEHLVKTLQRFKNELEQYKKEIEKKLK